MNVARCARLSRVKSVLFLFRRNGLLGNCFVTVHKYLIKKGRFDPIKKKKDIKKFLIVTPVLVV